MNPNDARDIADSRQNDGMATTGDPLGEVAVLTGPSGDMWTYGPADAASTISGPAAAFCRVGAQRLSPTASGLHATGPFAETALRVLRNYAA